MKNIVNTLVCCTALLLATGCDERNNSQQQETGHPAFDALRGSDVIVSVNGETMTKQGLLDRIETEIALQHIRRPNWPEQQQVAYRAARPPRLLAQWIDRTLLVQEAKKMGATIDPERVQKSLDVLASIAEKGDNEKEFKSFLATLPGGERFQRAEIEAAALAEAAIEKHFGEQLDVTDSMIEQVNEEFRKLVAETQKHNNELLAKAREVHQRLVDGEDFAKLADEFSAGGDAEGGDMGEMTFDDIGDRVMLTLMKRLNVGEISDVTACEEGWVIYKVLAKTPKADDQPETVTPARILFEKEGVPIVPSGEEIRRQLAGQIRAEFVTDWLNSLREAADIKYPHGEELFGKKEVTTAEPKAESEDQATEPEATTEENKAEEKVEDKTVEQEKKEEASE